MRRSGFTLIELMIYVAVTAMVVVALTHVMITILETRNKTQYIGELQYSLRFSMDRMVESITRANDIDLDRSRLGAIPGILSLTMNDNPENRTQFFVTNGRIMLSQGERAPEPLTPPDITIDSLRFDLYEPHRIAIAIEGSDPSAGTGASATMSLRTSALLHP